MNVLFYTDYVMSPVTGGIGRVTDAISKIFRTEYGWGVYNIYASDVPAEFPHSEIDGGVRLRLHDRFGIRSAVKRNYRQAVTFIKENKIDVVIIQTPVDVVAKLRRALDDAGLKKVKIIFCLHYAPGDDTSILFSFKFSRKNDVVDIIKKMTMPVYRYLLEKVTAIHYSRAYESADKVVLLSKHYIDGYCEYAQIREKTKFVSIPNPLPFDAVSQSDTINLKQNKVLFVGRILNRQKRVSAAIEIWSKLEPAFPDWEFDIVGDGPDIQVCQKQIESLSLERCHLLGRQDPVDYYARSRVFIMTSSFEGFPMTLIEAMYYGCVPVAFNSFLALGDIIEDSKNGFIVKNDDCGQFENKMVDLLSDSSSLREMSLCASLESARFTKNVVTARWKQLLVEVTNNEEKKRK